MVVWLKFEIVIFMFGMFVVVGFCVWIVIVFNFVVSVRILVMIGKIFMFVFFDFFWGDSCMVLEWLVSGWVDFGV